MAPSNKTNESRRKSGSKPEMIVTLKLESSKLREILKTDEDMPSDETPEDIKQSPDSTTAVPAAATANTNGENASDSNAATPQAEGTPAPGTMPPPADGAADGSKKKGVKRSAPNTNDPSEGGSNPKTKKPGPKKKAKLDDGNLDASKGGHKLGPKANQGAINAGLRALDRSGKPCRKWARGGFRLKTFTGVVWEINRWTAPNKNGVDTGSENSAAPSADADSSNKENKENAPGDASAANSNNGAEQEATSAPSVHASSPAPMAVAAAS